MTKQVLGKGLGALLPSIDFTEQGFRIARTETEVETKESFLMIDVSLIRQNPLQPRKEFDEEALLDLQNSIQENGIISPITVRRSVNGGFELVAGERRWRAAQKGGLQKVPAYIVEIDSDVKMLELALIENVQRENLNPIEIASGYQKLIEECKLTQEEVALKIGKDRTTITNFLRLLKLPQKIQDSLRHKEISMGHARALLAISQKNNLLNAWQEVVKGGLSVRATEQLAKDVETGSKRYDKTGEQKLADNKETAKNNLLNEIAIVLKETENHLRHIYGTQVKISTKSKESGTIDFEFYSKDDFERLIDLFNSVEEK